MKRFLLLVAFTTSVLAQSIEVAPATPTAQRVRSLITSSDARNVYAPAGYTLLWTKNGRVTPQASAMLSLLQNAEEKGLVSSDYAVPVTTDAAAFDVALTEAALRYLSDVGRGRVRPAAVDFDLEPKTYYFPLLVMELSSATDIHGVLARVEPQSDEYRRLLTALAAYRRIANDSVKPEPLPVVAKLSPGDTYDALPQLGAMLRQYGDLAAGAQIDGTKYEGAIVDAVKRFQSRHGLEADGIISKRTFTNLNVPASARVQQLAIALERARWTPPQTASRSIVVNIPEFTLRAKDERGELTMRVVVGTASRTETPVFTGELKHVVFRPYWNVPPNIQRTEIAAKAAKDRGWLARNGYEITDHSGRVLGVSDDTLAQLSRLSVRVRQKPGTSNALGLVKFLFPNDNNVYLHDTPSQSHFARARRDFSHGCIRLAEPEALAAWALQWTPEKTEKAMKGKDEDVYVKLSDPIAVTITYNTATVDQNGDVHFFDDIYGHDKQLLAALHQAPRGKATMQLAQAGASREAAAR
jgi:L,D-transpeptidase YcbB